MTTLERWKTGELPYVDIGDLPLGTTFEFYYEHIDGGGRTYELLEKLGGRATIRRANGDVEQKDLTRFVARDVVSGEEKVVTFNNRTGAEAVALGAQVVPHTFPSVALVTSPQPEDTTHVR